ncbi:hypothetical protein ABBQ32_008917 [Trebouxia sp. C0010 RCD-2024]
MKSTPLAAAIIALAAMLSLPCKAGFSGSTATSYSMNANKMGLDDQAFILYEALDQATLAARNKKLQQDMAPSVHRYNMFWNSFESSSSIPSDSPISCERGYHMVPSDSSGLKANGGLYNRYRCISLGQEKQTQKLLQADAAIGWESAAIVWCAPVYARDPACLGQPQGSIESSPDEYSDAYANFTDTQTAISSLISDQLPVLIESYQGLDNSTEGGIVTESALDSSGCSCVPTDEFMPDFQDFMAYLGDKTNQGTARWDHYIVWNECANAFWTDMSPRIDVTKVVTPEGQKIWVDVYANMIKLAQAVVQQPALVYVSTDRWWGVPPVLTKWKIGRAHMGTQNLLLGLWDALGLETEWSLVVHVYGGIDSNEMNGENGIVNAYGWPTLYIVAAWQQQQLEAAIAATPGTSYTVDNAPQRIVAATEQGWEASQTDDATRAKWMCQAFDYGQKVPNLAWMSWFDFQLPTQVPDDWSTIRGGIDADLDNAMSSVTYRAIAASNPSKWGKDSSNYCCASAGVGCP